MEIVENSNETFIAIGPVALDLLVALSDKVEQRTREEAGDVCDGAEHLSALADGIDDSGGGEVYGCQNGALCEPLARDDIEQRANAEYNRQSVECPPHSLYTRAIKGCGRASEGQFRSSLATGKGSAGKNIGINLMPMSL